MLLSGNCNVEIPNLVYDSYQFVESDKTHKIGFPRKNHVKFKYFGL